MRSLYFWTGLDSYWLSNQHKHFKRQHFCSVHYAGAVVVQSLSHVRLFVTPKDCSPQGSMGFSRQDNWSGLPFLSPEDLPNPRIKPMSPALAGGFSTTEPPGKPYIMQIICANMGMGRARQARTALLTRAIQWQRVWVMGDFCLLCYTYLL